jgi:hypothetical protein
VLTEWRQTGSRRSRLLLAAACLPWLPLLAWGLMHSAPLSAEWLTLLRLRSAHHSFPSTFGEDLPGVAALLVLTCLALPALSRDRQRLLAAFLAATALHFVLGTFFSVPAAPAGPPVPAPPVLALRGDPAVGGGERQGGADFRRAGWPGSWRPGLA